MGKADKKTRNHMLRSLFPARAWCRDGEEGTQPVYLEFMQRSQAKQRSWVSMGADSPGGMLHHR